MAEVHIWSYFSIDVDLAAELRSWPEFRSGELYAADLATYDQDQRVSVRMVDATEQEHAFIRITAASAGYRFDRVLGRVTYALAAASDHVMVDRVS